MDSKPPLPLPVEDDVDSMLQNAYGACGSISDLGLDVWERTVYLWGDIDEEGARRLSTNVMFLDSLCHEPIRVILNSGGGFESEGYAIYDLLRSLESPILVDGLGSICSISAIILQAGDVRRLAPSATFMIHNGSVTMNQSVDQDRIVSMAKKIEEENQKYYEILAARSSLSITKIKDMSTAETFLSSSDAIKKGFADYLWLPKKKSKDGIMKLWVNK